MSDGRGRAGAATRSKASARAQHQGGLLLVGIFKLSKAVFFTAVAAGALHLVHRNIGDVILQVADLFRLDPESRLTGLLLDKASLISHHQLRQAAMASGLYAGLCLIEGVGLILEKSWAEYFTVVLTTLALPWELFELARKFSMFKVGLVLVNFGVLIYLLWVIKRKREDANAGG